MNIEEIRDIILDTMVTNNYSYQFVGGHKIDISNHIASNLSKYFEGKITEARIEELENLWEKNGFNNMYGIGRIEQLKAQLKSKKGKE